MIFIPAPTLANKITSPFFKLCPLKLVFKTISYNVGIVATEEFPYISTLIGIIFLLIQGVSELLKSYWAAKKGEWPGETK